MTQTSMQESVSLIMAPAQPSADDADAYAGVGVITLGVCTGARRKWGACGEERERRYRGDLNGRRSATNGDVRRRQ